MNSFEEFLSPINFFPDDLRTFFLKALAQQMEKERMGRMYTMIYPDEAIEMFNKYPKAFNNPTELKEPYQIPYRA